MELMFSLLLLLFLLSLLLLLLLFLFYCRRFRFVILELFLFSCLDMNIKMQSASSVSGLVRFGKKDTFVVEVQGMSIVSDPILICILVLL
jgi:hypothetical protein